MAAVGGKVHVEVSPGRSSPAFTVYSIGDSKDIATWSNVPYFFTSTLEGLGYQVVRVDIGPHRVLRRLHDAVMGSALWLFGARGTYDYFRSRWYQWVTRERIRAAVRAHHEHHHVFLTFSFGAEHVGAPFVVFGDMTLERHIRYFLERPPNALERRAIRMENGILDKADLVVSLFPELARELQQIYGDKVKYYGNVVNIDPPGVDADVLLGRKTTTREFVFIGKPAYKPGLHALLDAVELLNAQGPSDVLVHVIGMDRHDVLRRIPANVHFHGYLDKSKPLEYRRYIEILRKARAFVNPNPKWAAFSASCEAMYMFTPVILFPYPEFTSTFKDPAPVGQFLGSNDPTELAACMRRYVEDLDLWRTHARNANDAVKDFTWTRYVEAFVADVEGKRHRVSG